MPLGKRADGTIVGPSSAQRSINAKKAAAHPLRQVVDYGVGADPERPYGDVDVLECGHTLTGARDMVGRRYPDRRRCWKCTRDAAPEPEAAPPRQP